MELVPTMVIEIHVPLRPAPILPDGAYPYPWIQEAEDLLAEVEDQGDAEIFDDGEEDAEAYIFFVTGAGEEDLLAVASRVAALPGVPAGTFAVISEEGAEEFGLGRRIALPLSTP